MTRMIGKTLVCYRGHYRALWALSREYPTCRESFCESGEGVRLPRERGWPPGKSGNFRGSLGNFRGKFGKLPGNLWIAVKCHSERTSGEVAEKRPGKFGERRLWSATGVIRALWALSREYPTGRKDYIHEYLFSELPLSAKSLHATFFVLGN